MKIATLTLVGLLFCSATLAFAENYMGMKPIVHHDKDVPWIASPAFDVLLMLILFVPISTSSNSKMKTNAHNNKAVL